MKERTMKLQIIGCVVLLALIAGCGEDVPQSDLSKLTRITSQEPKKEEAPTGDLFNTGQPADAGQTPQGGSAQPENTYGQGAPIVLYSDLANEEVTDAQGRVGKRGEGFGGGIYTEPIRVYFRSQDQITFIQMINNIKTYRALHNDQNPPTIEEFVKECLTASNITLSELPPGHKYAYDPSAKDIEKVMNVVQPAK
jgi:hypothetical protein